MSNTINTHKSERKFVMVYHCSVVPGKRLPLFIMEIYSQPVIRIAMLTLMSSSQAKTNILKRFVRVQCCIKIPLFVPSLNKSIVVVDLDQVC